MDTRQLKALEIAARMRITQKDDAWIVPSQSGNGSYRVVLSPRGDSCTCPDFELTAKECKHIYAARFVCERDYGGQRLLIDPTPPPARKTYTQNWPAYNLAQSQEKHRFQALLADLCAGIPQPPRAPGKAGRPPVLLADAIFAATFKIYSTVSTRRFACDLADAHERGYLSKSLHYNSVNAFLENPEMAPILRGLIAASARPLKAVEVDFAIDSSGFSSSRFVRWYDHKYGRERVEHDWVKVHIACGVKTNIVTAVEIHDRNAGDSPQFKPLTKTTAENFTIREMSGDKAYSSVDNLETVEACGGTAFIPFKSNATGGAGGLWEKMFHYFHFRRDEFLAHYHKRSNVESVFSAIKRKFGDAVRSRTDASMRNEALCKILCHNLTVVIQEQVELGIEATFWPEQADQSKDILPLMRRS